MTFGELLRRQLLEEVYESLSDEQKRAFVQLTLQNKDHKEIMSALDQLSKKADNNHHSFASDFAANVAGNAVWDIAVLAFAKLIKRL